jgi:hypothetical protein
MIRFNATYLKHLLPFKATEQDPRYYLNSIHIAPHDDGGAILIACNGYTMMCVRDATAICDEPVNFIARAEAAKYGAKHNGHIDAVATINPTTQRLTITGGDGLVGEELYIQPGKCLLELKGKDQPHGYVDWRKVLPRFDNLLPGGADPINIKYHEMAAKSHPLSKRLNPAIRFWQTGPSATLVVEFCDAPEFMLLIMPLFSKSPGPQTLKAWGTAFGTKPAPAPMTDMAKTAADEVPA